MDNFFPTKKKISSDIPKWSFSRFETERETSIGNRKFFFSKFSLLVYIFGVKFTENYHVVGIIT